ncbi:MAG: metallophosphoesterase [Clostridiales Family XIII bacterium]|jgi:predicted MPP superfamily phosphohydrolase|nr:metallophosphoesterase [Clostridiales Family XIII bacterium]
MSSLLDIFDQLIPSSPGGDGAAQMEFGVGWIFTIIIVIALNLYIAWHYIAAKWSKHRRAKIIICAAIHIALMLPSFLYWANFFGGHSSLSYMKDLAYYAGYYLCIFFYSAGVFFIWDIIRLVRRLIRRIKNKAPLPRYAGAKLFNRFGAFYSSRITVVLLLVCAVFAACAYYAPQHIVTTNYNITIDRRDCKLDHLKAVMISDTHIGPAIREKQIKEITERIMAEEPDIIFLAGDIFDEGTPDFLKEYTSEQFSQLYATYGVYFILGNHDDYKGDTDAVLDYFTRAGIKCLRDDVVLTGGSFYVIGREDHPDRRDELAMLETIVTEDLPVILLDHRPVTDESSESGNIQLQVSGHTHDGQIYPAHWFDPAGITHSYGHYKEGQSQIIVSSGAGEFGVPMRLGSRAEIVVIDITLT